MSVLTIDTSGSVPGLSWACHAKLRVEYEAGIYHVMNRGDQREPIFQNDADLQLFSRP